MQLWEEKEKKEREKKILTAFAPIGGCWADGARSLPASLLAA